MLIPFFYTLNLILLLSALLSCLAKRGEKRFSLSLVQVLVAIAFLAAEYGLLGANLNAETIPPILFSEYVFGLLWFFMAMRFREASGTTDNRPIIYPFFEIATAALFTGVAGYFLIFHPVVARKGAQVVFPAHGAGYFLAIFVLLSALHGAWRLEQFWRGLEGPERRRYKTLVVGGFLVCGALAWEASYRLTFFVIKPLHLHLLVLLFVLSWLLMGYGVARHRLLNRKIFVSRKVVYSSVAPGLFAAYLVGFGIISLVMRFFGLSLPFILKWLVISIGLVCTGLYVCSGRLRRRVHFFISTHFYVNKYEYRDEWLALSGRLQGAQSEKEVVDALREVLAESLYTTRIFIWLGDSSRGYRLVSYPEDIKTNEKGTTISQENPLVRLFASHPYFYLDEEQPEQEWKTAAKDNGELLSHYNLKLLSPISASNQLVGIIGLGPEFTGGRYGRDDFDLLAALGNHGATAILAVRMAEELARTREQQAWDRLSAFVLHDIKNAASMLSLLRENAPEHIHEPEFQEDMLEVVDDALRRMRRVEERLRPLKGDIAPAMKEIELGPFLKHLSMQMEKKLSPMQISVRCEGEIKMLSDTSLLSPILENLLLNALEAGATVVEIRARQGNDADNRAVVEVVDNGMGIAEDLLPEALFEPFRSNKEGGSGIGLWQVKKFVTALGGSISAGNMPGSGARFEIRLPLSEDAT